MMRGIIVLAIVLTIAAAWPATAAPSLEQYYNSSRDDDAVAPAEDTPAPAVAVPALPAPTASGGGSHVVTSVKSCFKEIGAAAAAEIRRTSLTPYADCQKVLRAQAQAKAAAAAEAPAAPVAETPRNFRRVTDPAAAAEEAAEKTDKQPPSSGQKKPRAQTKKTK